MSTVHRIHSHRKPQRTAQERLDDAIGDFLLIVSIGAGVLLLCWLVSLPFRHLPL